NNLAMATTTHGSRTPSTPSSADPSLTRWETVGAWLHIWTPPKGLEVPPVPWRKLALWGLVGAIVIGAAAAIAVPRIDKSKQQGAAERARQAAAADNAERARLRADQRVHKLAVPAGVAPGGARRAAGGVRCPPGAPGGCPRSSSARKARRCPRRGPRVRRRQSSAGRASGSLPAPSSATRTWRATRAR